MAQKKVQKPEVADPAASGAEFRASYELTTLMTEEAASLMSPSGARNPAYLIATGGIFVLLLYILISGDHTNTIVATLGAFVCAAFLIRGTRWNVIQGEKLEKAGVSAAALEPDKRRFVVDVWPDYLDVHEPTGNVAHYQAADVKRVLASDLLILAVMTQGRYVIIPRKSLSLQRFTQCKETLQAMAKVK